MMRKPLDETRAIDDLALRLEPGSVQFHTKDKAAVRAAISSGWSNGQAEGQICKLKLVRRQMYGRGKLDLLQSRIIGAT
jgi:transposase